MKTENKNLLLEMINYLSNKTDNLNYLKKINKEVTINEDNDCYNQIRDLIEWLDLRFVKLLKKDEDKLLLRKEKENQISNIEKYIDNMKFLFLNCPQLKQIFKLEEEIIYFNSKLSKKEQQEIRQFVDENRTRKVTNFYIRPEKNSLDE